MQKARLRKLIFTGLCIALGVSLPIVFHAIPQSGKILLPMHLPVLLCGLLNGGLYGGACGLLTPLLSSVLTGMPPAASLPGMLCELFTYGLVAGLLSPRMKTRWPLLNIYIPLLCAMLAGRVVMGITNALIFRAGSYSLEAFLTASFLTALPGIVLQLLFLPATVLGLQKAQPDTTRF